MDSDPEIGFGVILCVARRFVGLGDNSMAKEYMVWIDIEEHDTETDGYAIMDAPGASCAMFDNYDDAYALAERLTELAKAGVTVNCHEELLAALEECVERLASHDDQSVPELLVAHAAIAKAKGDA